MLVFMDEILFDELVIFFIPFNCVRIWVTFFIDEESPDVRVEEELITA